ncbi:MAG: Uncharacterized protein SCO1141, partial [uncultured Acidimicrobiales bacterium]
GVHRSLYRHVRPPADGSDLAGRGVLPVARRRAAVGVRAPCHCRSRPHGDRLGLRSRSRGAAGSAAAPRRPLPAPPRGQGPRRRPRAAGPDQPVVGRAGAGRTPPARHVAERGPRRLQRRQPPPDGAPDLPYRL